MYGQLPRGFVSSEKNLRDDSRIPWDSWTAGADWRKRDLVLNWTGLTTLKATACSFLRSPEKGFYNAIFQCYRIPKPTTASLPLEDVTVVLRATEKPLCCYGFLGRSTPRRDRLHNTPPTWLTRANQLRR